MGSFDCQDSSTAMSPVLPDTDGANTTANATSWCPADAPSPIERSTIPAVSFPFQQEPTTNEQPGLDEFLDHTPVDNPDQDVIGPHTSTN